MYNNNSNRVNQRLNGSKMPEDGMWKTGQALYKGILGVIYEFQKEL
jgi:hypothetical protein